MTFFSLVVVGEPPAPIADQPPQAEDLTRNQIPDAKAKEEAAKDVAAPPKVKTEKECTSTIISLYLLSLCARGAFVDI